MMKTYKGFDKNMKSRGFQYEEGKEYEWDNTVQSQTGFQGYEMPLDVFRNCSPTDSVYHEVEQYGDLLQSYYSTKVTSTKIKIGARLDVAGLVKAQIEFISNRIKKSVEGMFDSKKSNKIVVTSGDRNSAIISGCDSSAAASGYESPAVTSGDWSSAATSGGFSSAITSGKGCSAATSGYYSSAVASGNDSSAVTSGYESSAVASGDNSSAAVSGHNSSAVASGDCSSAVVSGHGSLAVASGKHSSAATDHKDAIAFACGRDARGRGVIGSHIVLTECKEDLTEIVCVKVIKIDGETYQPDTWYTIKNGEVVKQEEMVVVM